MYMKQRLSILLCGLLLTGIMGCGSSSVQDTEPEPEHVENADLTLSLTFWNDDKAEKQEPVERQGAFTGDLLEGKPVGSGKFVTKNPAGEEWYYEGEFTDGAMTGQGGCYWPESDYQEVGTYADGLFVPTKPEFFDNMIRWYSSVMFKNTLELDDASIQFISDHPNIFPISSDEDKTDAMSFVDSSIEYKHLSKSTANYLNKLIYFKTQQVLQTEEFTRWGHTVTRFLTCDANYENYHYIFYDGAIDIFDNDNITFVSLPVGNASFDNIGGGSTNVIVSIASVIIKN